MLKQADESLRPKPEAHEELGSNWVGAGDLHEGDVLKRANDQSGVVLKVATVRLTQPMHNPSVAYSVLRNKTQTRPQELLKLKLE